MEKREREKWMSGDERREEEFFFITSDDGNVDEDIVVY